MIRQKTRLRGSNAFLDLVEAFPLKPIRTEADQQAASRTLRQLVGSKPEDKLSLAERDYLETLTILLRDYQQNRRREAQAGSNPAEILLHLMDEHGMNVTDLGRVIGSRTAASMILNNRREPSKAHILRLAERFGVDPGLFLAVRTTRSRGRKLRKEPEPAHPHSGE